MTAVVISTLVSRAIRRESIYTIKLLRRGVNLEQEELGDVLRTTTIREAMTRNFPTLPPDMKIGQLIKTFQKTPHHGFPVVDKKKMLVGVLTESDIAHYLETAYSKSNLTAGDIVARNPLVAYPDQSLARLLDAIEASEARIPVISRETKRLLGVVGRHELISIYREKTKHKLSTGPRRPKSKKKGFWGL
jgi:CIC family chloride channel protein